MRHQVLGHPFIRASNTLTSLWARGLTSYTYVSDVKPSAPSESALAGLISLGALRTGSRPKGHSASQGGFTLVELLVATSIMTLVGGVCVAVLAGGIGVWQRAMEYGTKDQASLIASERMRRDLQNVRRFAPIPPEGTSAQYTFAAVDRAEPGALAELGQLGYFLDLRERRLCRAFVPYRLMRRSRLRNHCQPVLDGVTRLAMSYFGAEGEGGDARWSRSWESSEPPAAVKVTVELDDDGQTRTYSLSCQ